MSKRWHPHAAVFLMAALVVTASCSHSTSPSNPATTLVFTTQPVGTTAGGVIDAVVVAHDAQGNTATSFAGQVTMLITAGTGTAKAHLTGTVTVAAVGGTATFSGLGIDSAGTGYSLTATTASATSAVSDTFTIRAGPAAKLAVTSPKADAAFCRVVNALVLARDALGNTASGFTEDVTVALTGGTGTAGAHLTGTTTLAAVGGSAAFTDLAIDLAGTGYTLTATAAGQSDAVSAPFNFLLSNCWTPVAPAPTARAQAAAGEVNGVLYVAGGAAGLPVSTLEAYNPVTNTWSTKAPMPTARYALAGGVVNGIFYVIGGFGSGSTVEAYDPVTNSWAAKAPMPTPRFGLTVLVVDNILYAIGGQGSTDYLSTVEAYDPATDTWTSRAPMPTARAGSAGGVVNGIIYVAGGSNGAPLATVTAYDPATNSWTDRAPMPTARYGLLGGTAGGLFYAIGGQGPTGPLATVEAYDPLTNAWTARTPMATARSYATGGSSNGMLYSVGGIRGTGTTTSAAEAYTP